MKSHDNDNNVKLLRARTKFINHKGKDTANSFDWVNKIGCSSTSWGIFQFSGGLGLVVIWGVGHFRARYVC